MPGCLQAVREAMIMYCELMCLPERHASQWRAVTVGAGSHGTALLVACVHTLLQELRGAATQVTAGAATAHHRAL